MLCFSYFRSSSGFLSNSTNNVAEYGAGLLGVSSVRQARDNGYAIRRLHCRGDSKLVVTQMTRRSVVIDPSLRQIRSELASLILLARALGIEITWDTGRARASKGWPPSQDPRFVRHARYAAPTPPECVSTRPQASQRTMAGPTVPPPSLKRA